MQTKFKKNNFAHTWLLIISLFLSACVTPVSERAWPSNLPSRQIFEHAWATQRDIGANTSSLENHLVWIRRFYEGSVIYPIGWNHMSNSVLDSLLKQTDRQAIQPRLRQLGIDISVEWAQSNAVRRINSSAIAVWGNALQTAVELDQQFEFIDKIELDVAGLLAGKLNSSQIVRERYYPAEDYDNF